MTVRTIRYIVDPASACPPALRGGWGRPQASCQLDMRKVALCAMGEVLQTAPTTNPFLAVFDDLLAPGESKLIWQGDSPGRGVEMRRAFSGLFGRFFARAYLEHYHDFTWLGPINGDPLALGKLRQRPCGSFSFGFANSPRWREGSAFIRLLLYAQSAISGFAFTSIGRVANMHSPTHVRFTRARPFGCIT